MKIFLRVLLVLFLLVASAAGIFLATFDADRYRPALVQKLEASLGRPVRLEKLSLQWKGELAVDLHGLEIPPAVRFDRIHLLLLPLLDRQVAARGEMGGGTFRLDGKVRGWTAPLEGEFRLQTGNIRLSNVNLLREAFDRLAVIPGLTELLLSRLPPSYAQKLTEKDTLFRPMDLGFRLEPQAVSFQELRAATDSFELALGPGQVGFDGSLRLPARIFIQPDLSAALVRSVEELGFLADGEGRITLPVRIEGTVQKPSVSPDLESIASQLFSGKAQDLLGGLLNKVLDDID